MLETIDRNSKLNIDGIRKYLNDLVTNSIKISVGGYNNLFQTDDNRNFWQNMANECAVAIVFNNENSEIFIIGSHCNVNQFQDKMLTVLKLKQPI